MAEPTRAAGPDRPDDNIVDLDKVAEVERVAKRAGVRFDDLLEAALLAEFETGKEEESVEAAKAHLLVRVARIIGGSLLVIVGLAGFILPILPGWILLFVGLGLLAQDIPFARRMLDKVKKRMPQDENGKIPRSTIIAMVAFAVLFTAASIGFAIWRQSGNA